MLCTDTVNVICNNHFKTVDVFFIEHLIKKNTFSHPLFNVTQSKYSDKYNLTCILAIDCFCIHFQQNSEKMPFVCDSKLRRATKYTIAKLDEV